MDNMRIYNAFRKVPARAKKTITGGRLNGMTSINPMWRIEVLTEVFGPCGIGWYYEITDKRICDGFEEQKIAVVDINLYVKVDGEWSKPISGTGGAAFVAKERNGMYVSDECFKMALTDALSIGCKALGIGADVWYKEGEDKYAAVEEKLEYDVLADRKASVNQVAILKKLYTGENLSKLLEKCGVGAVEDISMSKASEIIKKLKERAAKKKGAKK